MIATILNSDVTLCIAIAALIGTLVWMGLDYAERVRSSFFFEEIACAAIRYDDVGVITLPAPARHHHIMWARCFIDGGSSHNHRATQGFLTTTGRFVDRRKACEIATKRGQIVEKHGNPEELYSEDMWDTPPEARDWTITKIVD